MDFVALPLKKLTTSLNASSKINPTKDSDFDDSDFALYEKLKAKNKKTLEEKASESKKLNLSLKNHPHHQNTTSNNSKLSKSGSYNRGGDEQDQEHNAERGGGGGDRKDHIGTLHFQFSIYPLIINHYFSSIFSCIYIY